MCAVRTPTCLSAAAQAGGSRPALSPARLARIGLTAPRARASTPTTSACLAAPAGGAGGAGGGAPSSSDRVATATALYERAWSTPGGDALLEDLVSENHAQVDAVWQPKREPAGGRAALKKGMRHMRRIYPDLAFTVVQATAHDSTGDVFVEWVLRGTWEGRAESASGISLLSFDAEGRIRQTRVYRQALDAEVEMAKRGVRGSKPVEQGVLLD